MVSTTTLRRKILAATAMASAWPLAALAHQGSTHPAKASAPKKEQKDWGIAGDTRAVRRSLPVGMSDSMRFTPAHMRITLGDTVRFRVRNRGQVMHEFVIGTEAENAAHAALMLKFPNMEHDEPYMAHVPPGQIGTIVWTFNRPGQFEFACLIPGHYDAGMKGRIVVS